MYRPARRTIAPVGLAFADANDKVIMGAEGPRRIAREQQEVHQPKSSSEPVTIRIEHAPVQPVYYPAPVHTYQQVHEPNESIRLNMNGYSCPCHERQKSEARIWMYLCIATWSILLLSLLLVLIMCVSGQSRPTSPYDVFWYQNQNPRGVPWMT